MEQRLNWENLVVEAVRIRKQEKLTQRQLAALAGVTQPTVVKFEKGSTMMRVESALSILAALGLAERP
ncbi:MAG: helix-turn-helix transcriptional regulator [Proteobacteria bacterium]|nr:helix-turn-helix transcriptional regulator [Pseudomonadota bacterium]